jgi:DNA polymerase-3 subunit gamma/tau
VSITSGEDVDVLEIDAASNRGIDEVREIRQNVQYRPARARYKIYIIDEVHMLTAPAFNALLKTLEEPPAHVKFILATTEVQRIPVTILSRCQRFDFAGISTPRIIERLKEVVAGEGMDADAEALELVARRAGGSMRDAQSLLDQLLAFRKEEPSPRLTADQVHLIVGTAHADQVAALATAILEHETSEALALLDQRADQGLQFTELVDQLVEYWRDLMVVHSSGSQGHDLFTAPRYLEALAKQASDLPLDTILAGLDILTSTKARLRGSNQTRILVEMAIIRLSRLEHLVSLTELAHRLEQIRPGDQQTVAANSTSAKRLVDEAQASAATTREGGQKKKVAETDLKGDTFRAALPLTGTNVSAIWREVLTRMPPLMARNLERMEFVAISGPNALVFRFPSGYNFQRELCQEPDTVARIEEALQVVTGHPCVFRVEPVSTVSAASPAPVADTDTSQPSRYRRQRAEALNQPLVKRAFDRLGAQIVQVDDGFGAAPPPPEGAERIEVPESVDGEET